MLLIFLMAWCGTVLALTHCHNSSLIGLLVIAAMSFFLRNANELATDLFVLYFGVTFGKAIRILVVCRNEFFIVSWKKSRSEVEFFLCGLCGLLSFLSWWQPHATATSYRVWRWTGLWNNPNTYGLLMSAGLLLAVGLVAAGRRPNPKLQIADKDNRESDQAKLNYPMVFLAMAIFIMSIGLFFSYSRGAWAGTAIALCYLAWNYGKLNWRFALLGVAVVASVVFLFWQATPDNAPWYIKRLDLSRPSAQHRVAAWSGALQMMLHHPFGVGWNRAVEVYAMNYAPPEGGAAALATNNYLMLGTQLGWPGLACFVAYVGLCLRSPGFKTQWERDRSGRNRWRPAERSGKGSGSDVPRGDVSDETPGTAAGTVMLPEASLRITCRSAALGMAVAFWFDGGLFTLATASVFWVMLELGKEVALPRFCGLSKPGFGWAPIDDWASPKT
jgi:hypothetical protein